MRKICSPGDKGTLIGTYIDEKGRLQIDTEEFGIWGFKAGDEIPVYKHLKDLSSQKNLARPRHLEGRKAVLFERYMLLDPDICRSHGVFDERREIRMREEKWGCKNIAHYITEYFVKMAVSVIEKN